MGIGQKPTASDSSSDLLWGWTVAILDDVRAHALPDVTVA